MTLEDLAAHMRAKAAENSSLSVKIMWVNFPCVCRVPETMGLCALLGTVSYNNSNFLLGVDEHIVGTTENR